MRIPRPVQPAFLGLLVLLSGCASAPAPQHLPGEHTEVDHRSEIESLMQGDIGQIDDKALEGYVKADSEILEEHQAGHVKHSRKRHSKSAKIAQEEIPKEIDARVRWWIYYYAVREHVLFQRMLDRGEDYRKMITGQLAEHLMPPELFNLAMIESGFVARAKSDAEAVGIWQFIPTTGTQYGLHFDAYSDDRNHPLLATQAAIRHLLYLRKRFKSWNLVLAAYNAGPERISKAMRRGKSDNFWELARKHALPSETMDYIPKFMAAVIISSHYEKFGFRRPVAANPYPELVSVKVKPGSSLAQLSRKGDIELAVLKHFNPQLKTGVVPPKSRRAEVWIPAREAQDFRVALATKPRSRRVISMIKPKAKSKSKTVASSG